MTNYNYYYLGRSAFPDILIWAVLCLILGGGGLVTMMYGISASSEAQAILERHEDQLREKEHRLNGSNMESAMQAVSAYRSAISSGAIDARDVLERDLLNNARLERRHVRTIVAMIREEKSDEEVQAWLRSQMHPGLIRDIAAEKALITLYDGLVNGSDEFDVLNNTLDSDPRVPVEIRTMAKHPEFDMLEGARAKLNFHKGTNSNLWVQIEDLIKKEDSAMDKTIQKFKERVQRFPALREEYMAQSRKMDAERADTLGRQNESWSEFIDETKRVVDRKRKRDLEIFEKENELQYKRSLLVSKVKGQDFIPPLDLIDGTVLSSDPNANVVVIDIGRLNALRIGQRFNVYRVKGDTLHDQKGRIEVVSLEPNVAICRILESKQLDPIIAGDKIANGKEDTPFDRKISPTYVLSGRFYKSYSRDLVRFMIQRSGGEVLDEITKNVNYVIIGDQPDHDDINLSRQLGVRTIRVRDLPSHLDFTNKDIDALRKQHWN